MGGRITGVREPPSAVSGTVPGTRWTQELSHGGRTDTREIHKYTSQEFNERVSLSAQCVTEGSGENEQGSSKTQSKDSYIRTLEF